MMNRPGRSPTGLWSRNTRKQLVHRRRPQEFSRIFARPLVAVAIPWKQSGSPTVAGVFRLGHSPSLNMTELELVFGGNISKCGEVVKGIPRADSSLLTPGFRFFQPLQQQIHQFEFTHTVMGAHD